MNAIDDNEMERRAIALRRELDAHSSPKIDAFAVLIALKQKRYIRDYLIVPDAELQGEGRFSAEDKTLSISQSTAAGLRVGNGRALWTVAHEIGHLALGHGTRNRSASNIAQGKYNARLNQDEVDANRFAAAFLAPEELIDIGPGSSADDLSLKFGLSHEAASRRYDELLRRSNALRGVKRPLPSGVLDFLAEAAKRGTSIRPTLKPAVDEHILRQSQLPNFLGDPCPNVKCGSMTMVRHGLVTVCQTCGTQTGVD